MKAKELLRRLGTKDGPLLLDPRSPIEFRRGHVPGAVNAPVWKILLGTAQLPQNRSREMVLACMHGQRAYIANWVLTLLGYRNLDYLDGFLEDWLAAGLPWTTRPGEGKASPQRGSHPTPRPPRPAVPSARKSARGPTRGAAAAARKAARRPAPVEAAPQDEYEAWVKKRKAARKPTPAAPAVTSRNRAKDRT